VVDLDVADPNEPRPADLPDARNGLDVFDALAAEHAYVPGSTWTVSTASSGRHLYFRAPIAGGPWRNTTGRIGWPIDSRGAGGYVVAAGSCVGGRPYLVIQDRPPIELPDWLAAFLGPASGPAPTVATSQAPKGRGYIERAVEAEVARVLDAPHGQRNAAL